jgi:hypothetical protein
MLSDPTNRRRSMKVMLRAAILALIMAGVVDGVIAGLNQASSSLPTQSILPSAGVLSSSTSNSSLVSSSLSNATRYSTFELMVNADCSGPCQLVVTAGNQNLISAYCIPNEADENDCTCTATTDYQGVTYSCEFVHSISPYESGISINFTQECTQGWIVHSYIDYTTNPSQSIVFAQISNSSGVIASKVLVQGFYTSSLSVPATCTSSSGLVSSTSTISSPSSEIANSTSTLNSTVTTPDLQLAATIALVIIATVTSAIVLFKRKT